MRRGLFFTFFALLITITIISSYSCFPNSASKPVSNNPPPENSTNQQQPPTMSNNISSQQTTQKTNEVKPQILLARWDKSTDVTHGLEEGLNQCDIYVMNEDGSNSVNLSNSRSMNAEADWSPDKNRIVFQSNRNRAWKWENDIFIMDADGNNVKKMTTSASIYNYPSWSPNGEKITYSKTYVAYSTIVFAYKFNIYVMNADGSSEKEIVSCAQGETALQPQWFPDSKRIAYMYSENGFYKVGTIDVNTGKLWTYDIRMNWPMQEGTEPSFSLSPDGNKIAYSNDTYKDYYNLGREIYVLDLNSGITTQLTKNEYMDDSPCWSPDGSQILFARYNWKDVELEGPSFVPTYKCDECGLYKMNLDGSNQVKVPNTDESCEPLGWR